MKVLFVNHRQQQCGVYQFGKRFYELASRSPHTNYIYLETEVKHEFEIAVRNESPDVIIYNWYPITMPWLTEGMIISNKNSKHYFIFHDGNVRQNFDKYLFNGDIGKNINFPKEKTAILPRPLFIYTGEYKNNNIPTIGSFGFGGWQKGFTRLVELVNDQFDEAVINIQMPFAYFGDRHGTETRRIADECRKLNRNSSIQLNIDHTFLSNENTLSFLADNDINVFLYNSSNQGLSSVIDYALSVKRPIAITNDSMFKHIFKPEISVDKHSLKEIMSAGTKPLDEFYKKWNPENFYKEMDKVYDS